MDYSVSWFRALPMPRLQPELQAPPPTIILIRQKFLSLLLASHTISIQGSLHCLFSGGLGLRASRAARAREGLALRAHQQPPFCFCGAARATAAALGSFSRGPWRRKSNIDLNLVSLKQAARGHAQGGE